MKFCKTEEFDCFENRLLLIKLILIFDSKIRNLQNLINFVDFYHYQLRLLDYLDLFKKFLQIA